MNKTILAVMIAAATATNVYAQSAPAKSPAKDKASAPVKAGAVSGVRGADAKKGGAVSGVRGADTKAGVRGADAKAGVRGADAKAGPASAGGIPKGKLPH